MLTVMLPFSFPLLLCFLQLSIDMPHEYVVCRVYYYDHHNENCQCLMEKISCLSEFDFENANGFLTRHMIKRNSAKLLRANQRRVTVESALKHSEK